MGASGYSIAEVSTIPATKSVNNIIADKPGVKLAEASMVDIFLTRESDSVEFNVTVGGTNVYPQPGPANISTVSGSLPSTQDDRVITCFAKRGDEIIIAASNSDAADMEARALVKVMPVSDAMLRSAVRMRTGQV